MCDRRLAVSLMLLIALPVWAGDPVETEESTETPPSVLFERVSVVGSPESVDTIPGSVTYIDEERLSRQDYGDIHRILALVPGVNFQEEDGYGLRPNIGMRGTGVERSSKITTMEDGVLIAPAPYSAPSAYYFPTAARMEGIEVRKGSSSIRQGPFTNGGVLNLVSSRIPSEFGGKLNLGAGDNDTQKGHFRVGDSRERFGWLVETLQQQTNGFKKLDGGGDTGFELHDYLVKFRINSASDAVVFQALELKLGSTQHNGDETYLGLTDADFAGNPFRRYAGSQEDVIDTDHDQVQARYLVRPNDRIDVTATIYRNDFFRNWHKLQSVTNLGCADSGSSVSINSVLADPGGCAAELAVIRGDAASGPGEFLNVRNNRRDYYSQGIEAVVGYSPGNGKMHQLELGVRYHEDEEDRFQEEDAFAMTAARQMVLDTPGAPGSQANRVSSAEALALFVQDTISVGDWTVIPGVRVESIDFVSTDYADPARTIVAGPPRSNSIDEVIPGVGITYALAAGHRLFGGVHRGFAPPNVRSTGAEAEESLNFELGYRRTDGPFTAEVVGFFNDYDNLLGDCTAFAGCDEGDDGSFNGGEARVYGLEAALGSDIRLPGSSLVVPLNLAYTYTSTEFLGAFESDFEPWGTVERGFEFPYVPRNQASLSGGLLHERWSVLANLSYVDETRTVAGRGPVAESLSTDSRLLVDLSASYQMRNRLKFYLHARNLTDRVYVAARRPAGVRPGIDRTVIGGVSFEF